MVDEILLIVCGVIAGIFCSYIYFKFRELNSRLDEALHMMPSIEEIAKEVIKVKIPLSDLPPEMQAQFAPQGGFQMQKNPLVG